jgi:DNA excision repair protein ERCC-2
MIFNIDEVTVYFPYPYIYKEQRDYMVELKQALDNKQHCMLEMPTGTGKTITLLSLITSYQLAHPEVPKLVYCTRTVPEMEKALDELRSLIAYRESVIGKAGGNILALGLSSRRNMCVHDEIAQESDRTTVDAKCRAITASWVRQRKEQDPSIEVCSFFEGFNSHGMQKLLEAGVYTIDDLRQLGREKGWCPYFTARHMIRYANVIVYNYAYVIDPKIKDQVSKEIEKESIIVFDEAHNIDNVCIESLSCNLNGRTLTAASKNLATLNHTVKNATHEQAERLRREVEALERGMRAEFATQVNHEHTHLSIYLSIGNRRQGGDLINYEEAIAEQMPGEK